MAAQRSGPNERVLAVGNGAGFWGDNLDAPVLLARDGQIDVLTLEYLAELTMAILSHLRSRDPQAGFVGDFPELIERLTPTLREKERLRVVTNAGGLNPPSCARRVGETLRSAGLGAQAIGVVTGDDVLALIPEWIGPTLRPVRRSRAWRRGWWLPIFIWVRNRLPTHLMQALASW
jgi:hypothetical protein